MKNLIFLTVVLFSTLSFSQFIKKQYYKNGKIYRIFETNKYNIKNGNDVLYFENGTISEKKKWKNGKLIDSLFTYNEKGELLTKGFINKTGFLKLYKNNILSYEGQLDKDKLRGIVVYYRNDNVVLSKTFNDNKENGFSLLLDDKSLKPKFIYESNNDKRNGVLIDFYENGIMKTFRTNSLESKNSQYFEFYSNGMLKSIGNKTNGMYSGYVYYFKEDGKIDKKILYENGEIIEE